MLLSQMPYTTLCIQALVQTFSESFFWSPSHFTYFSTYTFTSNFITSTHLLPFNQFYHLYLSQIYIYTLHLARKIHSCRPLDKDLDQNLVLVTAL